MDIKFIKMVMKRKTHLYGNRKLISPYDAEDPDAKVYLGRIWLSEIQKNMLRDTGKCYLTDAQLKIMDKFEDKKISHLPAGWDAFLLADEIYEYVYGEPCPK